CVIVVAFFFFQAEDGIRVFHVTGVQTCALPISGTPGPPVSPDGTSTSTAATSTATTAAATIPMSSGRRRRPGGGGGWGGWCGNRSEERRVGKELRARVLVVQ